MEDTFQKSHQRSHAYPAYTIQSSFELVRRIYLELGSSTHQARETIAKVLNFSSDSLNKPLSTATQYGLLDMKVKLGYKPTSTFMSIYKPIDENEKRKAMLSCILAPKLYIPLLEQYRNNVVPSVVGLSTNLFRNHNIAENAAEKAAAIFIDNLKDLNLLDSENHLGWIDINSDEDSAPSLTIINNSVSTLPSNKSLTQEPARQEISFVTNDIEFPLFIDFKNGRKAKLIYPEGMTNEEWSKIIRIIEALKE